MIELLLYIVCGMTAGLLGGYLGLGGGIIMVPFMTVLLGVDIKTAVPVSVGAIVVSSLAASNEYLKKGMVDLELVVMLSIFTVIGTIVGSNLSHVIPAEYTRLLLTVILVYTAFSLLKKRKSDPGMAFKDNRNKYLFICAVLALLTGMLSALVGIGGGVILVPVLYLIIGLPLATARGTSSMMIGFSAAAATAVYFLKGEIDFEILSGVIVGITIGAKLGGRLGTVAKPTVVKVMFLIVMLYLAFKLAYEPLSELL